jgi:hypothetical protein
MSSDSRSSDYSILSRKTKLLQFEIKPDAIENWRCLNPHIPRHEAKDCAIQSLTFLQIIKDRKLAEYYADIAHKKGGVFLETETIPMFIYNNHPDNYEAIFVLHNFWGNKPFDKWYKILDKKLKQGHATILNAWYTKNNKRGGHAFVIGKDRTNTLYAWDPQQHLFLPGYDGLHKYFSDQNYDQMAYIVKKSKKSRKRSSSKSVSNQPLKKTKKRNTISPMDISKKSSKKRSSSSSKKHRKTRRKTHKKRDKSRKEVMKKRNTRQKLIEKKRMTKKVSSPLNYIYPEIPSDYDYDYRPQIRSSEL